ncbi:MAG: DUF885 family protein [Candidatus Marinimicrobia bacterium]|jgi:uncharacterized protein (DUF885 family)|nr:DUF885 family protein [Candidatus Neomarinimicrobiota bacterium]MBT3631500.1 DUF885 family protein [Candidatus Neomarinimicrobiota bacterium]MBT3824171.1 DUF885 family protein [Candidatus Neomarinimicrobiota bacterium]MBT4130357.1 DUF885 family protein [Candidatus Neomarinimicrobiota bacterium]MBT4295638.1 DUF885 family protein [Candidatus Neomarinimicrobiota bacterium]
MKILILSLVSVSMLFGQQNSDLKALSIKFIEWRRGTQPITSDDIPRIERDPDWVPDLSPIAVANSNAKYKEFLKTLESIPQSGWSRADSIDYLLLRSAIERVNWELNVLDLPGRHPEFYINQTVGFVFDLLAISSPFTSQRAKELILRLNSIPKTLKNAQKNLDDPVKPFAMIAIDQLRNIRKKMDLMVKELESTYPRHFNFKLERSANKASAALEAYSLWLEDKLPSMNEDFSVGESAYKYFLKKIALVPYSPEELFRMGNQEWDRSVTFETLEIARNKHIPSPEKFSTVEAEINQARIDEQAIRDFLEEKNILTVPTWAKHYTLEAMPDYLQALASFGELDDFTSPTRLTENSVRYIPDPSEKLGFFYGTAAHDPRPLIIHEGTPGHYFQLIQSWKHERPIRRYYIDSNANEGIGFYVEELLLQLGLFENKPHTREIIYRFMRLRALRVDVDINLAIGEYSISDASEYLASTVPMDLESASSEAAYFAATPGQAITYQIGKIQILKLISDARVLWEDEFDLKDYHDYMMKNGNVPIALQRWEYLGKNDEIKYLW